jgi:hypothetical protein
MTKKVTSSKLLIKQKIPLNSGLLREIIIWEVPKTAKYPDGIRYHLVLIDLKNKKILVLFDNHYPKGHHQHLNDGSEKAYGYVSMSKLIEDFLKTERREEILYESNEN